MKTLNFCKTKVRDSTRAPLALAVLMSMGLTACVSLGPTAPAADAVSATTPLLAVALPGYTPMTANRANLAGMPPELRLLYLVNPSAPVPAFEENIVRRRHCSAISLDATGEDLALSPAERGKLLGLFAEGLELENARHAWNFHMDRAEAQDRFLNGPAGPRRAVRDQAVAPRPRNAAEAARQAASPVEPPAASGVRQTFVPTPAIRYPTAPGQDSKMVALREGRERASLQLAHNLKVLQAQDIALKERATSLARNLSTVFGAQVAAWQRIPSKVISPQRLAAFDYFRVQQIRFCAQERGSFDERTNAALRVDEEGFSRLVATVIEGQRASYESALRRTTSTSAFEAQFAEMFGSPLMVQAAQGDGALNNFAQQRRGELSRIEATARLNQQKAAEAETARIAQEAKRRLADMLKRNGTPDPEEIALLVTEASVATSEIPFSEVRRVSPTSFRLYRTLLGVTFIDAELIFGIDALSCKPVQGKLLCSYLENSVLRKFPYGERGQINQSNESIKRTHTFRWTERGLVAESGLQVMHLVWRTGGGDSGNTSSSRDWVGEERENRSNHQIRKGSGEVRGPYDGSRRY